MLQLPSRTWGKGTSRTVVERRRPLLEDFLRALLLLCPRFPSVRQIVWDWLEVGMDVMAAAGEEVGREEVVSRAPDSSGQRGRLGSETGPRRRAASRAEFDVSQSMRRLPSVGAGASPASSPSSPTSASPLIASTSAPRAPPPPPFRLSRDEDDGEGNGNGGGGGSGGSGGSGETKGGGEGEVGGGGMTVACMSCGRVVERGKALTLAEIHAGETSKPTTSTSTSTSSSSPSASAALLFCSAPCGLFFEAASTRGFAIRERSGVRLVRRPSMKQPPPSGGLFSRLMGLSGPDSSSGSAPVGSTSLAVATTTTPTSTSSLPSTTAPTTTTTSLAPSDGSSSVASVPARLPSSLNVRRVGHVWKRGGYRGGRTSWKRRLLALKERSLFYYRTSSPTLLGVMPLVGARSAQGSTGVAAGGFFATVETLSESEAIALGLPSHVTPHLYVVITPARSLYCCAESETDRLAWVAAIERMVERHRAEQSALHHIPVKPNPAAPSRGVTMSDVLTTTSPVPSTSGGEGAGGPTTTTTPTVPTPSGTTPSPSSGALPTVQEDSGTQQDATSPSPTTSPPMSPSPTPSTPHLTEKMWEISPEEVRVLERIGAGSFGDVFRGRLWGGDVAVKVIHGAASSPAVLSALRAEIDVLSHLRHPNVVLYMGACTRPGAVFLVTEWCERGSLFDTLYQPRSPLSAAIRVRIALQTARGMCYLHGARRGIIHRDLKSHNLLLTRDYGVKVGDFGLTIAPERGKDAPESTATPTGTPQWMAPEVLEEEPLTPKVDVYGFGVVLCELLTRMLPFSDRYRRFDFIDAVLEEGAVPTTPVWAETIASLSRATALSEAIREDIRFQEQAREAANGTPTHDGVADVWTSSPLAVVAPSSPHSVPNTPTLKASSSVESGEEKIDEDGPAPPSSSTSSSSSSSSSSPSSSSSSSSSPSTLAWRARVRLWQVDAGFVRAIAEEQLSVAEAFGLEPSPAASGGSAPWTLQKALMRDAEAAEMDRAEAEDAGDKDGLMWLEAGPPYAVDVNGHGRGRAGDARVTLPGGASEWDASTGSCSGALRVLVEACLNRDPESRPSFEEIVDLLVDLLGRPQAEMFAQLEVPRMREELAYGSPEVRARAAREVLHTCSRASLSTLRTTALGLSGHGIGASLGASYTQVAAASALGGASARPSVMASGTGLVPPLVTCIDPWLPPILPFGSPITEEAAVRAEKAARRAAWRRQRELQKEENEEDGGEVDMDDEDDGGDDVDSGDGRGGGAVGGRGGGEGDGSGAAMSSSFVPAGIVNGDPGPQVAAADMEVVAASGSELVAAIASALRREDVALRWILTLPLSHCTNVVDLMQFSQDQKSTTSTSSSTSEDEVPDWRRSGELVEKQVALQLARSLPIIVPLLQSLAVLLATIPDTSGNGKSREESWDSGEGDESDGDGEEGSGDGDGKDEGDGEEEEDDGSAPDKKSVEPSSTKASEAFYAALRRYAGRLSHSLGLLVAVAALGGATIDLAGDAQAPPSPAYPPHLERSVSAQESTGVPSPHSGLTHPYRLSAAGRLAGVILQHLFSCCGDACAHLEPLAHSSKAGPALPLRRLIADTVAHSLWGMMVSPARAILLRVILKAAKWDAGAKPPTDLPKLLDAIRLQVASMLGGTDGIGACGSMILTRLRTIRTKETKKRKSG